MSSIPTGKLNGDVDQLPVMNSVLETIGKPIDCISQSGQDLLDVVIVTGFGFGLD